MRFRTLRRRAAALAGLAALSLAACDTGGISQPEIEERLAVVVNSLDNTLSLVPVDGGEEVAVREVGLGAQGSPVDVAVRNATAVVPLGVYPFAAVVDLRAGQVTATVPLPDNSGATGVAFVNDTLALVANPNRNSVTPVRTVSGTAGAEITVGTYPQAIHAYDDRVYVLNANLVNFAPAGPGSVTVLNRRLEVVRTIALGGLNPAAATAIGDRLYVLHSGTFGNANGSVSVIDLNALAEVDHVTGFGSFPTSIAASPSGELYVGNFGTGILVWDPRTRTFRRGTDAPLTPGGSATIGDLGFDYAGRLHVTDPRDCAADGWMHRVTAADAYDRGVRTGICPIGFALADIPELD